MAFCGRCGMSEKEAREDGIYLYKSDTHGILCEFCREREQEYATDFE